VFPLLCNPSGLRGPWRYSGHGDRVRLCWRPLGLAVGGGPVTRKLVPPIARFNWTFWATPGLSYFPCRKFSLVHGWAVTPSGVYNSGGRGGPFVRPAYCMLYPQPPSVASIPDRKATNIIGRVTAVRFPLGNRGWLSMADLGLRLSVRLVFAGGLSRSWWRFRKS